MPYLFILVLHIFVFIYHLRMLNFVFKVRRWLDLCAPGLDLFIVKGNTFICSLHFVGGVGPTEEHPDPLPLVEQHKYKGQPSKKRLKMIEEELHRRKILAEKSPLRHSGIVIDSADERRVVYETDLQLVQPNERRDDDSVEPEIPSNQISVAHNETTSTQRYYG